MLSSWLIRQHKASIGPRACFAMSFSTGFLIFWLCVCRLLAPGASTVEASYGPGCERGATCEVRLRLESEIDFPVQVFLKLDNFFQNHKAMAESMSRRQLSAGSPSFDYQQGFPPEELQGGSVL